MSHEREKHNINLPDRKGARILQRVLQQFDIWMGGFWKSIGGYFYHRGFIKLDEHTFTKTGCQAFAHPHLGQKVRKVWFAAEQPTDNTWNLVSVSWLSGDTIIQAEIEKAPCKVQYFNIY